MTVQELQTLITQTTVEQPTKRKVEEVYQEMLKHSYLDDATDKDWAILYDKEVKKWEEFFQVVREDLLKICGVKPYLLDINLPKMSHNTAKKDFRDIKTHIRELKKDIYSFGDTNINRLLNGVLAGYKTDSYNAGTRTYDKKNFKRGYTELPKYNNTVSFSSIVDYSSDKTTVIADVTLAGATLKDSDDYPSFQPEVCQKFKEAANNCTYAYKFNVLDGILVSYRERTEQNVVITETTPFKYDPALILSFFERDIILHYWNPTRGIHNQSKNLKTKKAYFALFGILSALILGLSIGVFITMIATSVGG